MNRARRVACLALPGLLLPGCGPADPRIGLVLVYRAALPIGIIELWFDQVRMLGGPPSVLYVSPRGAAHEARNLPRSAEPLPEQVRARWRFQPAGHPEAPHTWPEAEASAPLRAAMPVADRTRLHRRASEHRLRLFLDFDEARLRLSWEIRKWR